MKKFFAIIAFALATMTASAQSYKDLVKSQQEHDKYNKEMANIKPTSADKKASKERKKEGWNVMTGNDPMEIQICKARLLQADIMADDDMQPTKRYITHVARSVSADYDTAFKQARLSAQSEIAALLETKIVEGMQKSTDNNVQSAISATTGGSFSARMKALVQGCLTNMSTPVTIYRVLPNNNYQVEVMIAYDKKELKRQISRKLQQEMKVEGDKALNPIVDEALGEME